MTLQRRNPVPLTMVWVAIVAATLEGLSLAAIRLTRPLLQEEIRTTWDIYREQSERIRTLLTPDASRLLTLDSVLGWRYSANHRDAVNETSAQGLRSRRNYTRRPDPGVTRVAVFGDSFVYGGEVGNEDSWPALLEQLFPRIEVLNYGVGGYGVDQAYLRFREEGLALAPRVVIMGFATDDLRRIVNVYRRFISNRELPLVKPRFTLAASGDLVLLPNPVPRASGYEKYLRRPRDIVELGAHDAWFEPAIYENPLHDYSATVRLLTHLWLRVYRRYFAPDRLVRHGVFTPSSTAFRVQMALLERFAREVRDAGAVPLVVIFPDQESVAGARRGRGTVLTSLDEALAAKGIDHVDLTAAFASPEARGDSTGWFMRGGHYSPTGNRIAAAWLGRVLLGRTVESGRQARGPTAP